MFVRIPCQSTHIHFELARATSTKYQKIYKCPYTYCCISWHHTTSLDPSFCFNCREHSSSWQLVDIMFTGFLSIHDKIVMFTFCAMVYVKEYNADIIISPFFRPGYFNMSWTSFLFVFSAESQPEMWTVVTIMRHVATFIVDHVDLELAFYWYSKGVLDSSSCV